jgi:hypothetical protein
MKDEAKYSAEETVRRREAALKRMLATPHKPHSESVGKRKTSKQERKPRRQKKRS